MVGEIFMPYSVCCLKQPFFTKNTDLSALDQELYLKSRINNSLTHLLHKCETDASYIHWLAEKASFNGGEIIVQIGALSKYFGSSIFKQLNYFKQVQIIGETKENCFKLKLMLKNIFPNVNYFDSLNLQIEDQSVDAVHTVVKQDEEGEIKLLPDIFRVLNSNGVFYLTTIMEDYEIAIHQLCKEFNHAYQLQSKHQIHIDKRKLFLANYFSSIEVEEFTSHMKITNVDDLMVYILSEHQYDQLKAIILKTGLSKFRNFLENKMKADGAITIKMKIKLLTCRNI